MRQQEVDAARLRGHVVLDHPAFGVVLLGLAQQPLEIPDIAIDRGAEFAVAVVALADLVEGRLPVEAIEVTAEHPALAGAETLPDLSRGAAIDGAGDLVEAEAFAHTPGLRTLRPGRKGIGPLRRIARSIGIGQEIADRPSFAATLRLAKLALPLLRIAARRLIAGRCASVGLRRLRHLL